VGVKIGLAVANPWISQNKAGHLTIHERPENLPADLGSHNVHLGRHYVSLTKLPHSELKLHHLVELFNGVARTYSDRFFGHWLTVERKSADLAVDASTQHCTIGTRGAALHLPAGSAT
jgi:hypothetical protein